MKYLLLALVLPLAACSTKTTPPDAPQPPHAIGMANPASVYCLEKGGEQIPVQSPQGVRKCFAASPYLYHLCSSSYPF